MPFIWKSEITQGNIIWHDYPTETQITEIRENLGTICISDNSSYLVYHCVYDCGTAFGGHFSDNDTTANLSYDSNDRLTNNGGDYSSVLSADDANHNYNYHILDNSSVDNTADISNHLNDFSIVYAGHDGSYYDQDNTSAWLGEDGAIFAFHNLLDNNSYDSTYLSGYRITVENINKSAVDSPHDSSYFADNNGTYVCPAVTP